MSFLDKMKRKQLGFVINKMASEVKGLNDDDQLYLLGLLVKEFGEIGIIIEWRKK